MGDSIEGTEMAKAADSAITATASHISLYPRLIVTDDDSIEKSKRAERMVQGKQCLFKPADEFTETPDVCFCMEVGPECKDYRLQAMLHQMDTILLKDDVGGGEFDDWGDKEYDSVEDKINDIVRKQQLARSIYPVDPRAKKNKRIGRTVFYVTVGQMKHTQIILKKVQP